MLRSSAIIAAPWRSVMREISQIYFVEMNDYWANLFRESIHHGLDRRTDSHGNDPRIDNSHVLDTIDFESGIDNA